MKRTPLKRKSRTNEAKLRDRLWELCKLITRKRYGNVCYTCGKAGLEGGSWQTGHCIPSASGGAYLRYDLRNLRPQCYNCNINLGSNGAEYYRRLVKSEGQKYVDQLFNDKQKIVKADKIWLENKISEYELIYNTL